jgi:hypothetical protein
VLIAPVVSVIVARAMYSLIEVPCISAGRTVAGLFARRPLASDFALRESTAVVQSGSHVPRPSDETPIRVNRESSDCNLNRRRPFGSFCLAQQRIVP